MRQAGLSTWPNSSCGPTDGSPGKRATSQNRPAIRRLIPAAVTIKSRRGEVQTQARVGERVPPGTVFLAFHWREAPANMLTQDFALDPTAKIPEYKVCAVRLEKK